MGSDREKPPITIDLGSQHKEPLKAQPRSGSQPPRDYICKFLSILTSICAILCLVALCLAIAVGPKSLDLTGYLQQALRVYGVFLSILIIFVETEWGPFIAQFRLLESWLCRGFFQLFTALLTLELSRSTAPGQSDVHKSLKLYRIVAGCSLVGCAGLYILCGMLCWGRQKAKVRYQREVERQRVEEDIEALDHKRQELKGLLAMYSNA